jgi:uncharacterized membrane protein YbhN (UPF0104 family)
VLNPTALILYLAALVVGLWMFFRVSTPLSAWAGQRKKEAASSFGVSSYGLLEKVFKSFSLYRTFSTSEILSILGAALINDLFGLAMYVVIALSINIPISFVDLGWVRALGILAAWTPFTLPGGFGMREVSTIVLMTGLGIGAEQAAAFSLLLYVRSVVIALIGGVFELFFNLSQLGEAKA